MIESRDSEGADRYTVSESPGRLSAVPDRDGVRYANCHRMTKCSLRSARNMENDLPWEEKRGTSLLAIFFFSLQVPISDRHFHVLIDHHLEIVNSKKKSLKSYFTLAELLYEVL